MSEISYIGKTPIYVGTGTTYTFQSPVNIEIGQTFIIFLSTYGTGITPSISPSNWIEIGNVTGTTGCFFCYYYQATSHLIVPSWNITGLSNVINTSYAIILSGCTSNPNFLINSFTSKDNSLGNVGSNGFTTTKKTAIIQGVSIFTTSSAPYVNDNNIWSSTPTLTWNSLRSGNSTNGRKNNGYHYISHGAAISLNCPINTYTNFSYTLSAPYENLTMVIALSAKKRNHVLNLLKSF